MTGSCSVAIIAIFKNEAPYILEWIAHHLNIGVEFFYIADNESTDGTTEILAALDALKIIKHVKFPTPSGSPPQLPAYQQLMRDYGSNHDWVAFIDADEFITPQGEDSLASMLTKHSGEQSIGGVAINWAVYGSSHLPRYSSELVMERFRYRGEKIITLNKHFKSIVRVSAYQATAGNPHSFKLKEGFHYVHTDGRKVSNLVEAVDGLSKGVCWDFFRLNHYVVKSSEEFINKKNRGRATKPATSVENRNQSFFKEHDLNDVLEASDASLIESTKRRIEWLESTLTKDFGEEILENSAFIPNNLIYGHQDLVHISDKVLYIRGWAFSTDHKHLDFDVVYNDEALQLKNIELVERPDVQKAFPDAPLNCGFVISSQPPRTAQDINISGVEVKVTVGQKSVLLNKP